MDNETKMRLDETGDASFMTKDDVARGTPVAPHRDRGYAWVVCVASFISQIVQCGAVFSMDMFYIVFKENMQGDSAAISLISTINAGSAFFSAPIAGALVSKFGFRPVGIAGALLSAAGLIISSRATCLLHLYISYGFITGFGLALQYNPCLSTLPVYFNKWLGLATGIAVSGCGFGSTVFPLIIRYLEHTFGWRGALLLCAGTQLQSVVCAALFRPVSKPQYCTDVGRKSKEDERRKHEPLPKEGDNNTFGETEFKPSTGEMNTSASQTAKKPFKKGLSKFKSYLLVFKYQTFTLFCISQLLYMTAVSIIYTHYRAFSLSLGFTDKHAALLFFVIGVTYTIMRLLAGVLTHLPWMTPLRLCMISISLLGMLTCLMSFYTTLPLLIMYGMMFGTLCGPYNTLIVNVLKDLVPLNQISTALRFLLLFLGPGSLFGAPIAGFLYEKTEVYVSSFYLAGALLITAGILNLVSLFHTTKS